MSGVHQGPFVEWLLGRRQALRATLLAYWPAACHRPSPESASCQQQCGTDEQDETDPPPADPPALNLLDLPADVLVELLRHAQWSSRATCVAFRTHLEAGRTQLRLRWPPPHHVDSLALMARLPRLTTLDGTACPAHRVSHLASPALTTLKLSYLFTNAASLTPVAACLSLTSLHLRGSAHITDISPLTACVSLATLRLSSGRDITDLRPLTACASLTALHLCFCGKLTSIAPIAECLALTQLKLERCRALDDLAPLAACVSLTSLGLRNCRGITGIEPLAHCAALRRLDLSFNAWLEDVAPLAHCAALRFLDVRKCPALAGVGALAASTGLTIRR